jgi:hypothetical protein
MREMSKTCCKKGLKVVKNKQENKKETEASAWELPKITP